MAAPPPGGTAPLLAPQGGMGIDGNLDAGSPAGTSGDWLPAPSALATGVLTLQGTPLNPTTSFHFIDPYGGNGDLIFGGGLKWTDNPNTWSWTPGKPSSKTEINNVLMHIGTDLQGHTWTAIAADRASTSGDSYIDFEFLQNPLTRGPGGAFLSSGPHGGRTANDILLSLAFTGGGKVADFFAFRWEPVPGGGYAYVDATSKLPLGRVFVSVNTNSITVPYGAFGQSAYAAFAFAEAAIDLTALLGSFDPCLSMGFKTIMVKTKASASSTASIEDFIDPIQYSLQIGPSANAGPDLARCAEEGPVTFELNGKATPGLQPVSSVNWTVVSGSAALEHPGSLITRATLLGGSATLRLTVTQANGCEETDETVLTVVPRPVVGIAGPSLVCPGSTNQFLAPAGLNSYQWAIVGNGSIAGATDGRSVTVVAGESCATGFSLALNSVSNLCSLASQADVMVDDTTPPTLVVPPDRVLECPADTGTNATGIAFATDDCGTVAVSYVDSVTNGCGNTLGISRAWTATDRCGNVAVKVQTIVVQDLTPPQITAPPAITIECPAEPGTNLTGSAIANDACGRVAVIYSDIVSNSCGGARVIARTWTAVDECGNPATALQTITVRDTTPPAITAPPSVALECPADVSTNANGMAIATDLCGTVSISYSDSVSNACGVTKVVSRTWTATDECGNAAIAVQTLTVKDSKPPVLNLPPDFVLECPGDLSTNANGSATALDLCGTALVSFSDSVSNSCGGTKIVSRTWTATDECGNAASGLQTLTVRDTTPPVLQLPPNLTLECPADTATNATGTATAADTCGNVVVQFSDSVQTGCGATRVITRRWTATDECGNQAAGTQTITVRDTLPPALAVPPSLTLECPADTGTNSTGLAIAPDRCGSVVISFADTVSGVCGGARTIARLWTATDECGNSTNAVQTIQVQDKMPPALALPPDLVLDCPADIRTNATGVAVAQDACGSVALAYSDIVSNACGNTKVVFRRWTAVDSCGNSTNRLQTITVRDIAPPVLRLPPNLALECPGDTRTNATGMATALDGCGSVTVGYSDIVSNSCGSTLTVLRLWVATDQCGNTTNALQTIVVIDTSKPIVSCPSLKVQCPEDVPAPYATLAAFRAAGGKASDACNTNLTFALTADSGLVGRCPGTVTRVYRITDACGNFADCTQIITVDDTLAPVLSVPPSLTLECTDSLDPARTGTATATDNCSTNVAITWTDAPVPSDYSIKFYASDPAPDHAPYDPAYLKLGPASLACADSARTTGRAADPLRNAVAYGPSKSELDALTSLGAEPMCFGQIVPFQVVIEHTGSPGPENGTIEFKANWATHTTSNDEFGYDKRYMVYCAFVDYADPGIIDPHANARVEMFSSELLRPGTIDEQIQGRFRVSGIEVGDRVVVEIWVVLKAEPPGHMGGTIAAELVSAQKALTPPEQLTTGTQTVSIGNLSKLSPLPPPQAQPPLGPLPPQPPVPPGYLVNVIDRTWRAADECGNLSTRVQRFTLWDTTPPALAVPPDLALECPADTGTNSAGLATAQDACGNAVLSFSDSITNSCGGSSIIARTWTATDGYNRTNKVQLIALRDTQPPVLSAPPNVTLEFPAETDPAATGMATAQDACSSASVSFQDTETAGCGSAKTIDRQWVAVDGCGNIASATQTILVLDTTAPTLNVPPDATLECPADTSPASTGMAAASDRAGATSVSYTDTVTPDCGAAKTILRAWTAVDACGNSAAKTQTIRLKDTTAPILSAPVVSTFPADGDNDALASLIQERFAAVFSRGLALGVYSPANAAEVPNGLLWNADSEGAARLLAALKAPVAPQSIAADQTNPSVIQGGPLAREALILALNVGFNAAGNLGAGPNNFGLLTYSMPGDSLDGLTVSEVLEKANQALAGLGLPDGYEETKLTALLQKLNGAFAESKRTGWASANLSEPIVLVQCEKLIPPADPAKVQARDDCSESVQVICLPDVMTEYTAPNRLELVRTWLAVDACGNTNYATYRIRVDDSLPPVFASTIDKVVAAGDSWRFDEPTATDNCGSVTIRQLSTVTNTTPDNVTLAIRIWEAVDEAGNAARWQQTVAIVTAPTIGSGPLSTEVQSGGDLTLTVTAAGSGPMTYQWRFNGEDIAGATDSTFVLPGADFTHAGHYTVVVGNAAGTAISSTAVVNVAPRLAAALAGRTLKLTWPSPFILQWAATVDGPYWDVPDAASPFFYNTAAAPQKFFRLRAPEASLRVRFEPDGSRSITIVGAPGINYLVQASSDLRSWSTLGTGVALATVVDSEPGGALGRYYRVVPVPIAGATPAGAVPGIIVQPEGQSAGEGETVILSVTATGSDTLRYQWRFNNTDIPGANASFLVLEGIASAQAGSYSVIVGNGAGTVFSAPAIVEVRPRLIMQRNGKLLLLSWPGGYVLQSATKVQGPYADVQATDLPYTFDTSAAPQQFFRLRSGPAAITDSALAGPAEQER